MSWATQKATVQSLVGSGTDPTDSPPSLMITHQHSTPLLNNILPQSSFWAFGFWHGNYFFFHFGGKKDRAKATLAVICCFTTAHIQVTSQKISSIDYPPCSIDTVSECIEHYITQKLSAENKYRTPRNNS